MLYCLFLLMNKYQCKLKLQGDKILNKILLNADKLMAWVN